MDCRLKNLVLSMRIWHVYLFYWLFWLYYRSLKPVFAHASGKVLSLVTKTSLSEQLFFFVRCWQLQGKCTCPRLHKRFYLLFISSYVFENVLSINKQLLNWCIYFNWFFISSFIVFYLFIYALFIIYLFNHLINLYVIQDSFVEPKLSRTFISFASYYIILLYIIVHVTFISCINII